jgi:hypothetical protein
MGQESKGTMSNTEDPDSTGQPPDMNQRWIAVEVIN